MLLSQISLICVCAIKSEVLKLVLTVGHVGSQNYESSGTFVSPNIGKDDTPVTSLEKSPYG